MPEFDSTIKNVVVRDFLSNDENSQLEEDLRLTIEQQSQQDNTTEKLVISQECELITLMTKVKGRIEVNQTMFTFIDLSPPAEDGSKHDFRYVIAIQNIAFKIVANVTTKNISLLSLLDSPSKRYEKSI